MADKVYVKDQLVGGLSDGSKRSYGGMGYQDGIGVEFRDDPDKVTALKKLKKDSGSTVTDAIKWFIENNTDLYSYGDTGKIYKRTSAGTWSNPKTVSSSTGQGFAIFNSELWYADQNNIGKTSGGITTYTDNYFVSNSNELDSESNISPVPALTYAIPTSISEAAADKKTFVPVASYVSGFVLLLDNKNGRDLTVTLHDSSNVAIATRTIATAMLPAGAAFMRVFLDGSYPVTAGNTYHIHVTASGAGATMRSTTANDLSTTALGVLKDYNSKDVDPGLALDPGETVDLPNYYNIPTALTEASPNRKYFEPTKSTIAAISVLIQFKGSGNWTLVVHDENHNVIGTSTVANASIPSAFAYCRFSFSTYLDITPGQTYHFHLYTSSSATTTRVTTSSANDLDTVYYKVHYQVLKTNTKYHPMKQFLNKLCIGNNDSIATIDDSEVYDPRTLAFPEGESVRALETIGDFLVIATTRGTTIGDYGKGRIYLWDGTSDAFNDFLDVSGQVNAMHNAGNNLLYFIHGTEGNLSVYAGGITEVKTLKGVGENKTVEVFPGAMTSWEKITYFGISDGSTTALDRVVYAYGRKDKDYPNALSKDYPISTGTTTGTGLQITACIGINASQFFVAWKDGSTYGVDVIDTATDQASVIITDTRFDADAPAQRKHGKSISLRYEPITATQKITVAARLDNTGSFTTIGTIDGAVTADLSTRYKSFSIDKFAATQNNYWFEFEWRVTLATQGGGTTAPTLISVNLLYEVESEFQIGRVPD